MPKRGWKAKDFPVDLPEVFVPAPPIVDREYDDDDRDDMNARNVFGQSRVDEDYAAMGYGN